MGPNFNSTPARHMLEGQFPTIGSWVRYGLGSLNDDLPQFVVMGTPIADCCGGLGGHGASYLGPEYDGITLSVDPRDPLPFASPAKDVFREEQAGEFDLLGRLNRLSGVGHPDDPALKRGSSRTSSPSACRLPFRAWSILGTSRRQTHRLYGLDQEVSRRLRRAVSVGPANG